MAAPKTQKDQADVEKFLAGVKDEQRRADCLAVPLKKLIKKAIQSPQIQGAETIK